jgi:hypothetical protein
MGSIDGRSRRCLSLCKASVEHVIEEWQGRVSQECASRVQTSYDDDGGRCEGRPTDLSALKKRQGNKKRECPARETLDIYNCAKSARRSERVTQRLYSGGRMLSKAPRRWTPDPSLWLVLALPCRKDRILKRAYCRAGESW